MQYLTQHQHQQTTYCSKKYVSVVIALGTRPVPFRTRKLSPITLMVLHPGGCGSCLLYTSDAADELQAV